MADFRVGDSLVTLAYGNGLLTMAIQWFQRDVLRHPDPAWRSTHVEVIVAVTTTKVKTFSQTAPKAKWVNRNKALLQNEMNGDKPRYALFRFYGYSHVLSHSFEKAMIKWCQDKVGEGRGWKGLWSSIYDVGQLVMYPINWIAHKLGHKKHIAWLEKTKANVCSDAVVTAYRKGFVADGKQENEIYPDISSAEIAPSHTWIGDKSTMFRVY